MSDPRPEKPVEPTPLEHTPTPRRPPRPSSPRRSARSCSCSASSAPRCSPPASAKEPSPPTRASASSASRSPSASPSSPAPTPSARSRAGTSTPPSPSASPPPGASPGASRSATSSPRSSAAPSRRPSSCSSACPGPTTGCSNAQDGGFASNGWDSLSPGGFGIGGAIIVEILFTALFVIVILGVTHPTRGNPAFAGLVIGLTLTLIHLATIPIDNTSVNPARSIATAIYGGGEALVPAVGVHRVPDRRRTDRRLRLPGAVRRHPKNGLTRSDERARSPRDRAPSRVPAVSRRRASACPPRTR